MQLALVNRVEETNRAVVKCIGCVSFMRSLPTSSIALVVTSPPYNIGKEYETKIGIDEYVRQQRSVITECVRVLKEDGSICWEVATTWKTGRYSRLM